MTIKDTADRINVHWTDIYHALHFVQQENLSHQAVRLLQYIDKNHDTTVGHLAKHLEVTHNTASEHIKRLIQKQFVSKQRSTEDERKVIVVLTERGREVLARHTMLDDEKLRKILEDMDLHEVELIERAFHLLSRESKKCF